MSNLNYEIKCYFCGFRIPLRPSIANKVFICPKCKGHISNTNSQFEPPPIPRVNINKRSENKKFIEPEINSINYELIFSKVRKKAIEIAKLVISILLVFAIFNIKCIITKTISFVNPEFNPPYSYPEELKVDNPKFAPQEIKKQYSDIDKHALAATMNDEVNMDALSDYLLKGCKDEHDKARVLFRWISNNISYDADALADLQNTNIDPEHTFKKRKTICSGYARLFSAIAKKMNLESTYIGGQVRSDASLFSWADLANGHAWNAVKIKNTWHLLDCTWASGYLDKNKKYVKKFDDFYFLVDPDIFILSHFPNKNIWQLTDRKININEFLIRPKVDINFLKIGIKKIEINEVLKNGLKMPYLYNKDNEIAAVSIPLNEPIRSDLEYTFELSLLKDNFDLIVQENEGLWEKIGVDKETGNRLIKIMPEKGVLKFILSNQMNPNESYLLLKYNVK